MTARKEAHLAMIQGVVTRLGQNSFLLKGWSVLLVSALLALGAASSEKVILVVAFLPVLAFWGLDGYFLWQERLFRALYDHVRRAARRRRGLFDECGTYPRTRVFSYMVVGYILSYANCVSCSYPGYSVCYLCGDTGLVDSWLVAYSLALLGMMSGASTRFAIVTFHSALR